MTDDDDKINWDTHPDLWPHTPPLDVFGQLWGSDPNLFWSMAAGHAENLLSEAIDRIDQVLALHSELPTNIGLSVCAGCSGEVDDFWVSWPCETVRILTGETDD